MNSDINPLVQFITSIKKNKVKKYEKFKEKMKDGKFEKALKILKEASEDNRDKINKYLDTIPWRISIESYHKGDILCWYHLWIKMGWWPDDDYELSTNLVGRDWTMDNNDKRINIPTNKFKCVVWNGTNREIIIRLMECAKEKDIKVEYKIEDKYLVPMSFAANVKGNSNKCKIEIGSMVELPVHNLDMFRIYNKIDKIDNTSSKVFYRGCNMGVGLLEKDIPYMCINKIEDNDMIDEIDYNFDIEDY